MRYTDHALKRMALIMAANCVRNTIIEDYHAEGKLSNAEMMAFNREVVNKIYTFLRIGLFGKNKKRKIVFMAILGMMFPHGWDDPILDDGFLKALNIASEMGE